MGNREMKIAAALVMTVMFVLAAQDAIAADDLTGDCRVGTYRCKMARMSILDRQTDLIFVGGAKTARPES